LLLGYKPVQHVTVLNTVDNCNTVVSIILLYYNIMGPPSYMRSFVHRNVGMRRMTVFGFYLRQGLRSGVFVSDFLTKTLYTAHLHRSC